MINNTSFALRIKEIMEHYDLSASLFSDKIGVQRSSISHILSGRNKPSLDFVIKITNEFSEVDIYWLLKGVGSFPKIQPVNNLQSNSQTLFSTSADSEKKIQRIVVFYNDGTFDEFKK